MADKELYKNLKDEWEDELFFYTRLPLDSYSEIRCQLFFDTNKSYIAYNHKPCVFLNNGYTNYFTDDFIAIEIGKVPQILHIPKKLKIYKEDLGKAIAFVQKHYITLLNVAAEKINLFTAFKQFKQINESLNSLNEMAILPGELTGLAHKIWIDEGNIWKNKSGHGPRIKAEVKGIKASIHGPSISIPDAEVFNNEQNGKQILSNHYITLLKKFIQYNNDNLNKLINNEIGIDKFIENIVKVDKKGNPIYSSVEPDYIEKSLLIDPYVLVVCKNHKFNILNKNTNELIFDMPFDSFIKYEKDNNNKITFIVNNYLDNFIKLTVL